MDVVRERCVKRANVSAPLAGRQYVHVARWLRRSSSRGDAGAYLRVDVQHADASGLNHLVYGVHLYSVQVAVVLSMFKIAPVLDVGLHLAAAGEGIHATLAVFLLGFSGGIWTQCDAQLCTHTPAPFP